MSRASIVGAYNPAFGSFVKKDKQTGEVADLKSIYDLMLEAGRGALADAGVAGRDVDAVWVASCAPGIFANQEHLASFATEIDPEGLRFKPMTRCEDACASGSVALYDAVYAVEAGRARVALVLGVEKMNLLDTKGVTHALATCSFWPEEGALAVTFPCLFAEYAKGYQEKYGLSAGELARMLACVAALCYKNGLDNPLAHFGKGGPSDRLGLVTAEAILALPPEKNVVIAEPLRLHDCSLISDGAAAVVQHAARGLGERCKPQVGTDGDGRRVPEQQHHGQHAQCQHDHHQLDAQRGDDYVVGAPQLQLNAGHLLLAGFNDFPVELETGNGRRQVEGHRRGEEPHGRAHPGQRRHDDPRCSDLLGKPVGVDRPGVDAEWARGDVLRFYGLGVDKEQP